MRMPTVHRVMRALSSPAAMVVGALLLLVSVVWSVWIVRKQRRERNSDRVEGFLPLLFGVGSLGVPILINKIKPGNKKYVPTYVGRQLVNNVWSCPAGSVDTGMGQDKACVTSEFHPKLWRDVGGGKWDWGCPNGTVEAPEKDWEKKCLVGWMTRIQNDGKWVCPSGTTDSGAQWSGPNWHDNNKQCKRSGAFTVRVKDAAGKWVCPPGSKDTGRQWGSGPGEWDQCQWLGG